MVYQDVCDGFVLVWGHICFICLQHLQIPYLLQYPWNLKDKATMQRYYIIIYEHHQLVLSLNALGSVFLGLVSDLFRAWPGLLQAAVATLLAIRIHTKSLTWLLLPEAWGKVLSETVLLSEGRLVILLHLPSLSSKSAWYFLVLSTCHCHTSSMNLFILTQRCVCR